ncbi:MAG: hypothetical protein MJZ67_06575 [Bacteroidales bacterium]|nr:hypothetical protein [Bacteroidales bacterium]
MDYNSIKGKYTDAARQRRTKIQLSDAKVASLKEAVKQAERDREQYRLKFGEVSREKSQKWQEATAQIYSLNKRLAEAQDKIAALSLGEAGMKKLTEKL